MPIEWNFEKGNLAVFRVSGKLGKTELDKAQSECEVMIQKLGHVKILVVMENFSGWERTEGWEDMSFSERNDPFIEKIAIVGDVEWRDLVFAFTARGLRPIPIEYYEAGQESAAREWLDHL
jgi:hypothetical protein